MSMLWNICILAYTVCIYRSIYVLVQCCTRPWDCSRVLHASSFLLRAEYKYCRFVYVYNLMCNIKCLNLRRCLPKVSELEFANIAAKELGLIIQYIRTYVHSSGKKVRKGFWIFSCEFDKYLHAITLLEKLWRIALYLTMTLLQRSIWPKVSSNRGKW